MSEVTEEQDIQATASEQADVVAQESQEPEQKMVPLAALEAERRKRQDSEAKNQAYENLLMRASQETEQEPQEPEDPNALVEKRVLKETTAHTKREILETLYQDMNPEAVQKINKYLKPILEKKPWLATSVDTAQNRYARAYEIVQDYIHLVEPQTQVRKSGPTDAQRIVQNANKPGSPADTGKSAQPKGMEYLKSIQGKKEFREYRQKVLQGEA